MSGRIESSLRRSVGELVGRLLAAPWRRPRAVLPIRDRGSVDALLIRFVVASAPAIAIGAWNVGAQAARAASTVENGLAALGWRAFLLGGNGERLAEPDWLDALLLGASYFVPLLAVTLAVAAFWVVLFARIRNRDVDSSWLVSAWLFTALLPPSMPLHIAALGISFGIVLGSQVFGGTGRYIVSPPLLGVVYLSFAYPDLFDAGSWPGSLSVGSAWALVSTGGIEPALDAGLTWARLFLGDEPGAALGISSALACLLGAAYLVLRDSASWRTIVGAVIGLASAAMLVTGRGEPEIAIPWHWHAVLGSFAFGVAFIATDPTTMPLTRAARWAHGLIVGVLTALIRLVNPEHIEGTLFALVLASLAVPLLDHIVVSVQISAYRRTRIQ